MSKSEVSPRAWWIVKSFYPEQKEVLYRHKPEWKDIELGNERVKVIDHQAYIELQKENEELKFQLADRSECYKIAMDKGVDILSNRSKALQARIGKLEEVLYAAENLISYETPLAMSPKAAAMKRYERAMEALKEDGHDSIL